MKHVSLRIADELDARLVQLSKRRGVAKADVICDALESYFVGKRVGDLSCVDLAGNLVGCLEGPADLATNSKYLRGDGF